MKVTIPNPRGSDTELELFDLEYNGQPVLTTKQLAPVYGCTRQNICANFYNHIDEFAKGGDYFLLHDDELKIFMNHYSGKPGKSGKSGKPLDYRSAFALKARSLYLWTPSGALKHSQYLGTEKALKIFISVLPSYFSARNPAPNPAPQPKLPAGAKLTPNDNPIELLMQLIQLVEKGDENTLRNRLIRETASLILGRKI